MVQLLYKYLIIHKQVAVPGVGVFFIDRKPAIHDAEKGVFQSPVLSIDFRAETAITNKEFFEFVSKEKGIDQVAAVKDLHEFAQRLKQQVSTNKRVELPGMGTLIKNGMGQVSFEPTNVLTNYFPPTIEERIFKDGASVTSLEDSLNASEHDALYHQIFSLAKKKDYWWLFAIVLAIGAIAAILYYYYQNGSLL